MKKKVLILADSPKLYTELVSTADYEKPVLETSPVLARQRMGQEEFSIVIIAAPLKNGEALKTAMEIAGVYHVYVLLFVPPENLDVSVYACKDHSVFVMSTPVNRILATQAVSLLEKVRGETRKMEAQIRREKQRFQDEKLVSLCKIRLVEHYHWTEEKAHSYIGKAAMDHSTTRVNIARALLSRMEDLRA